MRSAAVLTLVVALVALLAAACGSSSAKPTPTAGASRVATVSNQSGGGGTAAASPGGAFASQSGTATVPSSGVKVHFTVTGTYNGASVEGSVAPGSLQCAPVTNGDKQGLQVTWSGTVEGTGQISGDMLFAGGLPPITFGDAKSQGSASVVVKGDYRSRYGASSALGSGTAQANADNSGTIDAELDGDTAGKIRLQGSWTC